MEHSEISPDDEFLINLILQRTGPFMKLGGSYALNDWFSNGNKIGLLNFLRAEDLLDQYLILVQEEIKSEFFEFRQYIPERALNRIVSIGPGNGLVELMLISEGLTSELLLIDIEKTDYHYHGYHEKGSGYASLSSTKKFLLDNLDHKIEIYTCNPTKEKIPNFEFTLLISLLSMGFHYPCNEYIPYIMSHSVEGSWIVLDKRRDSTDGGFSNIESEFKKVNSIPHVKSDRIIFHKF